MIEVSELYELILHEVWGDWMRFRMIQAFRDYRVVSLLSRCFEFESNVFVFNFRFKTEKSSNFNKMKCLKVRNYLKYRNRELWNDENDVKCIFKICVTLAFIHNCLKWNLSSFVVDHFNWCMRVGVSVERSVKTFYWTKCQNDESKNSMYARIYPAGSDTTIIINVLCVRDVSLLYSLYLRVLSLSLIRQLI